MTDYFQKLIIGIMSYLILSWLLFFLWNSTIPGLFNLPHITYIDAMALYIISNLLFNKS